MRPREKKMKDINREKNAKRNISVSLSCQLITMLCGLITPRFMLKAFGSEVNGAIASISTFLGYIMLLEGGIGGVARAALYKPLAEKDETKINEVMAEMKRFFRRVGFIFIIYVIILGCVFHDISHSTILDWTTSFLLVLIISVATFAQYFFGISNSILIIASQRQYINNIINIIGTVLNAVAIIILTSSGYGLLEVKLFSSFIFALKPLALWLYVKKNYNITPVKNKTTVIKDKWTGLGQHIAFFLHSHTDIVVLTLFGNLNDVSVYAVYSMVTSAVQNITSSFSAGMEAVFGDMYAKREMKFLSNTFSTYDTLVSIISIFLFGTTMSLIVPFVHLYTSEITDTNYIYPLFGLLLSIACLIYCLRSPYHNMIIAAGHFKQTNIASYGEAIINIITSIILVMKYGLVGVAIGTVLATTYRFVYYVFYLSKNIMKRKIALWIKRELVNIAILILALLISNIIVETLIIDDFVSWIKAGVYTSFATATITIVVNMLIYRTECTNIIKIIKRK